MRNEVIQDHLSVKEAMSALVSQAAQNDNISTIFVVNSNQEFYGAIDLKDLIIARQDHPLSELIVTSYPYVYGTALIDVFDFYKPDISFFLIPFIFIQISNKPLQSYPS